MPRRDAETPFATWRRSILSYVADHPDRPLKTRGLARELSISESDYTAFRQLVRTLLQEGTLVLGPGRTLRQPEQSGVVVGTFRANARGFGFVEAPGRPALYIARHHIHTAREGDTVAARVLHVRSEQPGPRGTVARIITRAPLHWVGLLEVIGNRWFVQPQGRDPHPRVLVSQEESVDAAPGELVVVVPDEHSLGTHQVTGRITECLGDPHDARAWIRAVIRRFELRDEFPPGVLQAGHQAAAEAVEQSTAGREDLRGLPTITIDPPDARDYDDAISVEPRDDGTTCLGVHIADVAHFVPLDGTVDREARARGTSVYFPGFVVPMLPEALSNEACSLQPGRDRLTKTVFITYDKDARVTDVRICNSVINSTARLSYEQVSAALDGKDAGVTPEVLNLLRDARNLARRIRRRRLAAGMLVLVLPEVKIQLDNEYRVTGAGPYVTTFANTIIEMFMVEANEAVSRELTAAGLTHLRRIHPAPEPEAAEGLRPLAPLVSQELPRSLTRPRISALLDAVRGRPEEAAVSYLLLRALTQACYSPDEIGHFALASDDYCHFTSPIRRYPDLTIHRLVNALLAQRSGATRKRDRAAVLPDIEWAELGRRTSAAERRAQQAERETQKCLLTRLMLRHIGEVFNGVVTGVMSFGVFVQLQPVMAEGLMLVPDFGPDEWEYDRTSGMFIGRRTRRVIHLGLGLRVRVAAVSEIRQEIELVPAKVGSLGRPLGDIHAAPTGRKRPGGAAAGSRRQKPGRDKRSR